MDAGHRIEFDLADFRPEATLAHVMHRAGIFPSVSQAKKAGWNVPIEGGAWRVGKLRKVVVVVDRRPPATSPPPLDGEEFDAAAALGRARALIGREVARVEGVALILEDARLAPDGSVDVRLCAI